MTYLYGGDTATFPVCIPVRTQIQAFGTEFVRLGSKRMCSFSEAFIPNFLSPAALAGVAYTRSDELIAVSVI